MTEILVYTLRPSGESIWLPMQYLERMGISRGERLTEAQYGCKAVQELLAERRKAQAVGAEKGALL